MLIGEGQRRALHERLVEVLGVDQADVLMEHLPPSGWGDVARRSDLDHLRIEMEASETRLAARIERLDTKLASTFDAFGGELRAEMARQSRAVVFSSAVLVVGVVGSLITALITLPR